MDSEKTDQIPEENIGAVDNPDKIEPKKEENNSDKIYLKKSTWKGLLISLVVIAVIASFFAGSYVTLKSDGITKSEFNSAIEKLDSKIAKTQVANPPEERVILISADDDPVKGNPNAPITIIEFSDFQCPFCARFHEDTLPLIIDQYVNQGKVKFVYRDFPIQSIHPNAMPAAVASECADEQDKYWEYHDMLFANQRGWSNLDTVSSIKTFKEYATKLNLNEGQFNTCLDSGKYVNEINQDLKDGSSYGINGTPGFFVGNEKIGFIKINGAKPFEEFKNVIDYQLNS